MICPQAVALAMVATTSALFAVNISLRLIAALASLLRDDTPPEPSLADHDLPHFTLLAPLYKEAEVARQSVRALSRLDYPAEKLQVLYLVEADDTETIRELCRCRHLLDFDIIALPHALPRTKPRALNYGLSLATGDIISVYDAEDLPDPQQLRHAAEAFAYGDDTLAVVQAELAPYNRDASWIAGQFTLEYNIQFKVWLPFIADLGWPLSLGGTSNHFDAAKLRAAGGWDPYNVTEDADLGFRLAAGGYSSAMIPSVTLEEAPVELGQWLKQRSRWIKGHLQTWLVIMRDPLTQMRAIGVSRFIGLQLTFTLSLVASFLHGPLLLWTIWHCFHPEGVKTLIYLGLLSAGYLSAAMAAVVGLRGQLCRDLSLSTLLTMPFYWPLQSIAAMRALWEMRSRPHEWAKTRHGLSRPPVNLEGLHAE